MKNIILITIDSLRADHVGSLGYAKSLTSNLDELAKNGVLFTHAFSYGPTTFASIPPLLTSSSIVPYYDEIIKAKKNVMNLEDGLKIYKELVTSLFRIKPTIAGVLNIYGYETAGFHSNPYLTKYYGYGGDFSYFDDSFVENGFMKNVGEKIKIILVSRKIDKLAKHLYFLMHRDEIPYERASIINKKAISWLKERKPEKFFLWLHYMDTHIPYIPPKNFRSKISSLKISELNRKLLSNEDISEEELAQIKELYDGNIKYLDSAIKSLLDELDDMNILGNTIIIITADHGEEFKDHGGFLHPETKLYDELLHVPLIIYGTEYTNIKVDETVSLIDIAPTIIDLLNLKAVKTFQGRSLIPIIKGEKNTAIISQCGGHIDGTLKVIFAYRTNLFKYILDEINNKEELYNLKEDPKETKNLININKNIAKEFKFKTLDYLSHQYKLVADDMEKEKIKQKVRKLREVKKK